MPGNQSPGDSGTARDRLFDLAYRELRGIAARYMSGERSGHTLQPTALVHEAYLKLRRQKRFEWNSRSHFVVLAAQAMRQVLVDVARRRQAGKRRGERVDWTITLIPQTGQISPDDYLAIHEALDQLADQKPNGSRHVRLIELVWLGGLEFTEAAQMLGISRRQAHRDWAWARTWLEKALSNV
ncbi:MAG: sigma-70 family RNA polymerase sigma factor [Candidatus Eisenbacteria sp.]|nr:sigma-70 family RNA polymerase sigma factor [Candidatus Eisenbacteria bacterium]